MLRVSCQLCPIRLCLVLLLFFILSPLSSCRLVLPYVVYNLLLEASISLASTPCRSTLLTTALRNHISLILGHLSTVLATKIFRSIVYNMELLAMLLALTHPMVYRHYCPHPTLPLP
jgi:hypothetical protein